jgi:hypothetical protein
MPPDGESAPSRCPLPTHPRQVGRLNATWCPGCRMTPKCAASTRERWLLTRRVTHGHVWRRSVSRGHSTCGAERHRPRRCDRLPYYQTSWLCDQPTLEKKGREIFGWLKRWVASAVRATVDQHARSWPATWRRRPTTSAEWRTYRRSPRPPEAQPSIRRCRPAHLRPAAPTASSYTLLSGKSAALRPLKP